jgi:tRNA 2-thiouridine synthesizing protein E
MPTIDVAGKTIEVDEEGYLQNRSDWSEEVAVEMAKADGLELTTNHWEVINFLREYYDEYQIAPAVRVLTKAIGKKLGPDKGNSKYLYELFPYGPAKQACKYAGLPKPTGCV